MNKKPNFWKIALQVGVACSLLALTGCAGEPAAKSASDIDAFKGNPNSPAAQAAAQRGMAEDAQKGAAARAAAQGQKPAAPR